MTDATVQMLVSQLGNAGVQNSSKKEIIEACAGLPDFGKILSNAGQKNEMFSVEERGASQSWSKDVADSDTSVSNRADAVNKSAALANKSNSGRVIGTNETTSMAEKLGFGDGETDVEELADALCYLTSQMMTVLTENLNVTEEQVQNCLEQNNLIMTDLLDPSKFADIFVQLSGKNIELVDVVNDEEFTQLLAAFDSEINGIFGEATVDKTDLMNKAHILVDYNVVDAKFTTINVGDQVTSDDESILELLHDGPKSETDDDHYHLSDNMDIVYSTADGVKDASESSDNNNADMKNGGNSNDPNGAPTTSPDGDPKKKLAFTTGGDATPAETRDLEPRAYEESMESRLRKLFTGRNHGLGDNSDEINDLLKVLNAKNDVTPNSEIPTVEFSDMAVKVQEFIETMARDTKITSLSMQLNPENLGKVTVEVATKDGVLSAKVIAETQAAKEALEANLANLKSNLEQQGLKISDVEVTVESHAFEQNLQQDGSREQEQLAKEMKKDTARNLRNINLREVGLEELRGLMSEEDIVVAKMMADNGNTLNIKA